MKKILGVLLTLCMVLTLLPATARADEPSAAYTMDFTFTESAWTTTSSATNDENGDWHGAGWSWDASEKKLTLNGLNFTTSVATAIKLPAGDSDDTGATLVLEGANTVTSTFGDGEESYGIYANGALTITGGGSLTVTSGNPVNSKGCYGIRVGGKFTINGGSVTATGGNSSNVSYGVGCSYSSISVSGNAVLKAVGGVGGVGTGQDSQGIQCKGLEISDNAVVTATGGSGKASYGLYSNNNDITVEDSGVLTAVGGSASTNNSCAIYFSSSDSTLKVNGNAVVTAVGGTASAVSYGVYGNAEVNGGKLVAVGGSGSKSYGVNRYADDSIVTYTSGLLVAKGNTKGITQAAVGAGATAGNIRAGTNTDVGMGKYIVFGDSSYTVFETGLTYNSLLTNGNTNNIIIGSDSDPALTCGSELALSGFSVVLASGSKSAVNQTDGGALNITGTGTLVAVGGSDGGYGIESAPITPGDSSVIAIGKAGATSESVNVADLVVTGAHATPVMTWVPAMMRVGNTNYASFEAGWNAAVAAGDNAASPATVKLLKDWTADSVTHSFGTGAGFSDGAILVPDGKYINLDLGGKTIDRGLAGETAISNGHVISTGGNLTVSGTGKIKGGNTSDNGGGVLVDSGSFTMTGGSITENAAGATGGGVCIGTGGTFNVSGAPVIKDNIGGNVYLSSGATITVTGTLTCADDSIGVSVLDGSGTVTVAQGDVSHTDISGDAARFSATATAM